MTVSKKGNPKPQRNRSKRGGGGRTGRKNVWEKEERECLSLRRGKMACSKVPCRGKGNAKRTNNKMAPVGGNFIGGQGTETASSTFPREKKNKIVMTQRNDHIS